MANLVENGNENEILFQDVEFLMGGECECGNNALECTDDCCPADATDYCQKDTLTRLKKALGLEKISN
jgi:hypothetical protein|tara:strand:- start:1633 stop:1836 length:204 start_codon:yes stop_codon:yes gene_type:complete